MYNIYGLFICFTKKYVNCSYCIGDEYDSLVWYDHNIEPKPTEEELNIKLGEI